MPVVSAKNAVVTTAPLEEKVVVLEERAHQAHGSQYGLKMLGAALSNMTASGVSNPVDVIKVRQQLRTTGGAGGSANTFWVVGAEMLRSEGAGSLVHGLNASLMREFVYSGLRLGTYEYFKDLVYSSTAGTLAKDGLGLKVVAATIAATFGASIANPCDLVKVRMQRHYPAGSPYRSTFAAFAAVWREGAHAAPAVTASVLTAGPALAPATAASVKGGVGALYRGVGATTFRGIILSTSQICAYDQAKQSLKRRGVLQEGIGLHLVSSLFAGLFCSITSNPVDVIKVRVHSDKERRYKGVVDCVRQMLAHEGPLAFYKGFGMCWARLGTHTIVSFLAFERIRLLLGISPM